MAVYDKPRESELTIAWITTNLCNNIKRFSIKKE